MVAEFKGSKHVVSRKGWDAGKLGGWKAGKLECKNKKSYAALEHLGVFVSKPPGILAFQRPSDAAAQRADCLNSLQQLFKCFYHAVFASVNVQRICLMISYYCLSVQNGTGFARYLWA